MKAVQNAGKHYSLDHIWPQDDSYLELGPEEVDDHEAMSDCLGNLTLTTGRRNASWKNQPYEAKRSGERSSRSSRHSYENSDFASTRKVAADYETWGREQIEHRLEELVTFAQARWSLDPKTRREYAAIRPD